jgi:hypothetical protein
MFFKIEIFFKLKIILLIILIYHLKLPIINTIKIYIIFSKKNYFLFNF